MVGTSELRIQNVKMHLLNELKQLISTIWPHGVETESIGANHSWRVNFARTPWSSVGTDAIMYAHTNYWMRGLPVNMRQGYYE